MVSVVVPTFNRASTIAETLDSVLAQTYPRIEIIVVDDGSTDATREAVTPYLSKLRYIHQQNQGLAGARNTGHANSSGEFVAWLDSDDAWNREKIAVQVAFMRKHPECALSATDFSAFDASGPIAPSYEHRYYSVLDRTPGGLGGFFPHREDLALSAVPHLPADDPALRTGSVAVYHGMSYKSLVSGNCLHPPSAMLRRDAVEKAGPLDSTIGSVGCDYEYFVRLGRGGAVAFIDRPLMRYRLSPDQLSHGSQSANVALANVRCLQTFARLDPALLSDRDFRRRMGRSHLTAAHALADKGRGPAAMHLLKSLRWGHLTTWTARTTTKLLLPQWVVERRRKAVQRKPAP